MGILTPTDSSVSMPISSKRLFLGFCQDSRILSSTSLAILFLFLHRVTVLAWAAEMAARSSALTT